jgi:phosphoglycerate dehydrogenase-like enzyme
MEPIQVLCTMRFGDDLLAQLRAVSPRLHLEQETCHNAGEVAAALKSHPGVEILYGLHLPPDLLALAPGLRWLQLHSAGADHLQGHPIMASRVAVTTTSGIHAVPIAEYVMASILAFRWRVPLWTRCQRDHHWPPGRWDLYARPELRGSTIGILGYGSIGREVARLAQAFGLRVLALSRSGSRADGGYQMAGIGDPEGAIPEAIYHPEDMAEMLPQCDYIVVALPLTPATEHAIGEAELRAMKPGAYLVNIARGAVVDEAALERALREGWIGGAGLDVFEEEPLPAGSPLWDLDNALLSPHVAGYTPRYDERAVALFAANLARYLEGQPLLNALDKVQGY